MKDELVRVARERGICGEGYKRMLASDREGLVEYYIQNPDWCMERGFPDLQTLRSEFSDCEDKGVFVGKVFHGEELTERRVYIFHNCKGTIKTGLNLDSAVIPMLYVANGCRLRIVGTGVRMPLRDRPMVPVHVFGKNDVSARDNAYVRFDRYNRGLI